VSPTETTDAVKTETNKTDKKDIKREISVEIPAAEVARETELQIQRYQKSARSGSAHGWKTERSNGPGTRPPSGKLAGAVLVFWPLVGEELPGSLRRDRYAELFCCTR
jgi:hypothetical protein